MDKLEFLVDVAVQERVLAQCYREWYDKEKEKVEMLQDQLKEAKSELRTSKQMHDELTAAHLTLHDRYAEAQRQLQNLEIEMAHKDSTIHRFNEAIQESREVTAYGK
jgi:chromosome segregation ATPase